MKIKHNKELYIIKQNKKLKIIILITSIIAIISIIFSIFGFLQMKKFKKNIHITLVQKQVAEDKIKEAENNLKRAINVSSDLEKQKKELEKILKQKELKDSTNNNSNNSNNSNRLTNSAIRLLSHSLPTDETNIFSYYMKQVDTAFSKGKYDKAIRLLNDSRILTKNSKQKDSIQLKIKEIAVCIDLHEKASKLNFDLKLYEASFVYEKLQIENPTDPTARYRISAFRREYTIEMFEELKLVSVKGGAFIMGNKNGRSNEQPLHKVILSDFQISPYEITNKQYAIFLNQYGSDKIKNGIYRGEKMIYKREGGVECNAGIWSATEGFENYPVIYVTWFGANKFCEYYGLNLPTEAQWEYAARGGVKMNKKSLFAGANDETELDEFGWFSSNSDSQTHEVGTKIPNNLGLYDMNGNVWEWCSDWYHVQYYNKSPLKNPRGFVEGSYRVNRGGSWFDYISNCNVAFRSSHYPSYSILYIGFRVCLSV